MKRILWTSIIIVVSACCCCGRLLTELPGPRPVDRAIVRLPTFTPTPAFGSGSGSDSIVIIPFPPTPSPDILPLPTISATPTPPGGSPPGLFIPTPTFFVPLNTPPPPPSTLPPVTPSPFSLPSPTQGLINPPSDDDDDDYNYEIPSPTATFTAAPPTITLTPTPSTPTFTPTPTPIPVVRFSAALYTAPEDQPQAKITVIRSPASSLTTTVDYTTGQGTALAGLDYQPTSGTLTFSSGQTNSSFNIPLIDDNITNEFTETVSLTLTNITNGVLGLPEVATLAIIDDDGQPRVQFNSPVYTVPETIGSTPITLTLDAPSALAITVVVTISDGTARAGEGDYLTSPVLTKTFASGEISNVFSITILNDTEPELQEDINLLLSNPEAMFGELGPTQTAVLTIARSDMLHVSSYGSDEIVRYDGRDGLFIDSLSGDSLDGPRGITFGPDGHLYVSSGNSDQVLRYNGTTGAFMDVFVDDVDLTAPQGLIFGPGGDLYVVSNGNDQVRRYDGPTGAPNSSNPFANVGLSDPRYLLFGPDDNLYVSSENSNQVLRYDGLTGNPLGTFVDGLNRPQGIAFGPDDYLYVSNNNANEVWRFDGTGAPAPPIPFASDSELIGPKGIVFGPDGNLYVSSEVTNEVLRFDGTTGTFIDVFADNSQIGLSGPEGLVFGP